MFRLNRSTYRYDPKFPSLRRQQAEEAIVDLSEEHPELGADKIGAMVRRERHRVSNERVRKVRREEGLQVPPPRKKERRQGHSTGRFPQHASYRGHVWSWDFIHDWTLKGGSYRVLSVVDEFTRETHALYVDRHIGAGKVQEVMKSLIARHGAPAYIRSDNGPEFVSRNLGAWLADAGVKTLFIEPASPWSRGCGMESFHDKFRRECLNREIFYTLSESRVVSEDWRRKFNELRPHRSLGMATPQDYAARTHSPRRPRRRRAARLEPEHPCQTPCQC
jgi:transposase InsO family protein